ncbi:unnamed protein product [Chrysoparadoxa australica]
MTKKVKKEIQVILKKSIAKVGSTGTIVSTKSGYARNYLIPQKLAELATPEAITLVNKQKKAIQIEEEKIIKNCLEQKNALEQINDFIILKRVGEGNKIFGNITAKQILETITNLSGINLTNISLSVPEMNELGTYPIQLTLHPDVIANINISISAQ